MSDTVEEGRQEARRRWGAKAWANIVLAPNANGDYSRLFVVGAPAKHKVRGRVWGGGWSWTEAFRDAERRLEAR